MHPVVLLLSLALLSACSGGGGSGSVNSMALDDSATTQEDQSVVIAVTANDTNVVASSVTVATAPRNGSTSVATDGAITYTPDADFFGSDTLTYRVTSSRRSRVTHTAQVTITVTAVNDAPVAEPDNAIATAGNALSVQVLGNDSDVDSALATLTIEILTMPANGTAAADNSAGTVTYMPAGGFSGADSFTYRLQDGDGATSGEASVSLTVLPLDVTTLTVTELALSGEGYVQAFHDERNQNVLESPVQSFTILPGSVSFAVSLIGDGVNASGNRLFISELQDPDGTFHTPLFRTVESCDDNFCSLLVPKKPEIQAIPGEWQYRIASLASDSNITGESGRMHLALRTGPAPAFADTLVSRFAVNTVVTGSELTQADVDSILAVSAALFELNGVVAEFSPITFLNSSEFAEVSKEFIDPTTQTLISTYADASHANLFILDTFTDGSGTIGITAGIPGSLGVQSEYNGVMINGTATRLGNDVFHRHSTAQIIVHELGHYLGLNHTTEGNFSSTDLISDTEECLEGTHDLNGNGVAEQDECPDGLNIMFWQDTFLVPKTDFSAGQQHVMHSSPVAVTAGE